MGSSNSRGSALFLKIVSKEPNDESELEALKTMMNLQAAQQPADTSEIDGPATILSLTYKCVLKEHVCCHQGIRDIVTRSTELNRSSNISGEIRVVDPFARSFVIEQVGGNNMYYNM